MPTNKNALLRYRILDKCFHNKNRYYTIEDLVNAVNYELDMFGSSVSLRQIREDIKCMKEGVYNAPIKAYPYQGNKCYYRYTNEDFSIFKNELTEQELSNLQTALDILGRYSALPINTWLNETISKLEYKFGIKSANVELIEFEQNEFLSGINFLPSLIDFTLSKTPLKVTYQAYNGIPKTTVFHPYYLKQYNGRWFVFGLEDNSKYGKVLVNKALDRIVKFKAAKNVRFIPNLDKNFKTFFHDIVGVTIPQEHPYPEDVILKFNEKRFPYVKSKPIHHSQVVVDEQKCMIKLYIRPNKEFESQIFFFGPDVEIIEPQWLRCDVAKKIEENYKKYFSVQKDCIDEM